MALSITSVDVKFCGGHADVTLNIDGSVETYYWHKDMFEVSSYAGGLRECLDEIVRVARQGPNPTFLGRLCIMIHIVRSRQLGRSWAQIFAGSLP